MSGFNMEVFTPFDSENFGGMITNDNSSMNRLLASIRKDDCVANFWTGIPNLENMENELKDIDKEIDFFSRGKETVLEYEYIFTVKKKISDSINNLKKIIKERNDGRDEIERSCNDFQKQIKYFNKNDALITTDPKDIEFNRGWKDDISNFENKMLNYKKFLMSKIDTDIMKLHFIVLKHQTIYDKLMSLTSKINEEIYQVHFKDKMPKSNIFCTICFVNNSTHACVPCGHIFCGGCIDNIKDNCACCRKKVEKTIKLFNLDEINPITGQPIISTTNNISNENTS